jgi:hypothetical protein
MLGDKKGLSTIVVTLIIILISLVAVGIVWVVVRNVISKGTGTIEVSAECIHVNIDAAAAPNCSSVGSSRFCTVAMQRSGTGSSAIGGIKLVFKNTTAGTSSSLIDVQGNIEPLLMKTYTANTTLVSVNKVEMTAYFNDASGNQQICAQTSEYTF